MLRGKLRITAASESFARALFMEVTAALRPASSLEQFVTCWLETKGTPESYLLTST